MRKKYAELSSNELGEFSETERRREVVSPTSRYQGHVELDGEQRYEMQHEPADGTSQRPVVRQELGSTQYQ